MVCAAITPPVSSKLRQLQRDRGADDGFLPVVGDRQPAHPFHPIIVGAVDEIAAGLFQVAGEGFVGTKHQMQRPRQHERRLAVDQRQRRVGGQADHGRVVGIADVIAAERAVRQRLAVIAGRPHPDGDARQAGDRLDDAVELRRPEYAAELAKARREVGDPHLAAVVVGQHGARRSRCCAHIRIEIPPCRRARRRRSPFPPPRHQPAKDRIAVEARIAPPHDPRARIDQSGRAAVADDREIKAVIYRLAPLLSGVDFMRGANGFGRRCARARRAPIPACRNVRRRRRRSGRRKSPGRRISK